MDQSDQKRAGRSDQAKKLVFHIGDYKTGSTSIQYAYAGHKVQFENTSVLYPTQFNHNSMPKHVRAVTRKDPQPGRDESVAYLTDLASAIANGSSEYALISGETLEATRPFALRQMIDGYFRDTAEQISVVAYVRPHAARVLSSFAEQSKLGWYQGDLEQFVRRSERGERFRYFDRFSRWRKQFGDDFVLRPMIRRELHNNSVVDDFTVVAFDSPEYKILGSGEANASLSLQDLVALRYVQARFQHKGKWLRHSLGCELARLIGQQPDTAATEKPERLQLHRSLAEQVHEFYLEDAQRMDDEFFAGRPLLQGELDSALENATDEPQSFEVDAHYSEHSQRQLGAMADLVAGMLGRNVAWREHFREQLLTAELA